MMTYDPLPAREIGMVRANRRVCIAALALMALALPSSLARADCSSVGPAQVGDCPTPEPASQSSSSSTAQPSDARGAAARFYSLVNVERSNQGLARLIRNSQLESIALRHARRMAAAGRVYHNDALFSARTISALGNPVSVGENVGRGSSVDQLHKSFMASRAHRVNILDRSYSEAGFAVVYGSGQLWAVETFMSPPRRQAGSLVWAGDNNDFVRSTVLRFSGPALGAWRWSAPAVQEQEAFYVPAAVTEPQVLGVRETLKKVPGGTTGLAFALAFSVVLGAALSRRRADEEYV